MGAKMVKGFLLAVLLTAATACAPAMGTPLPVDTRTVSSPTLAATSRPTSAPTPVPSPTAEPPLAARVNGQPLYLSDFEQAVRGFEADLRTRGIDPDSLDGEAAMARARSQILTMMIEQALTEQAAAAAGIVISNAEVDAYMQQLIDENGGQDAFLAKLADMGDTYQSAWEKARAGLIGMAMMQRITADVPSVAEHVHARHILVDTPEKAANILAQLQTGGDFAALAEAYSLDSSTKEAGGDLGSFSRGILVVPEVEEAAFALQPGEFSRVVTSTLGYHVIQVIERDAARQVSPESLRWLQDQAIQKWIEQLWAQAQVERFVETEP